MLLPVSRLIVVAVGLQMSSFATEILSSSNSSWIKHKLIKDSLPVSSGPAMLREDRLEDETEKMECLLVIAVTKKKIVSREYS